MESEGKNEELDVEQTPANTPHSKPLTQNDPSDQRERVMSFRAEARTGSGASPSSHSSLLTPHSQPFFYSIIIFIIAFVLLNVTGKRIPLCWDEGDSLWRAEQIELWLGLKVAPASAKPTADSLPYITYSEGHPAFYGILAASGDVLGRFVPDAGFRTLFYLFYAFAIAAVFGKLLRRYPTTIAPSMIAASSMILIPRLYCHAHFAVNDSILTSCWVLAWVFFTEEEKPRSVWHAIPFGFFWGLTMASKFTGWLAIPCFAAVWLFHRNCKLFLYLLAGFVVAALTFYIVNPPLWSNPIGGMCEFFSRNLGREETFNLTGYFFGRLENVTYSLPWYNTTVWILITIPVGILALVFLGFGELWRNRQMLFIQSLILNAAVLPIVRALPHVPAHDNERLFITAFAFLAIIAGVGTLTLKRLLSRLPEFRRRFVYVSLISVVFLGSLSSWIIYAPHWLSYYNLTVGGLPGAYRLGLEPTYWWTDLDDSVLNWINENSQPGEKVQFQLCSRYNLNILIREKKLRVNYASAAPGRYRWYVMQTRPSVMNKRDWHFAQTQTPAHTVTIPFSGTGPWNLSSVPLIRIYDLNAYSEEEGGEKPLRGN